MYVEGFSPMVKYFPTDEMFFKLMRAGIGIREPTDLWFYKEKAPVENESEEMVQNENENA